MKQSIYMSTKGNLTYGVNYTKADKASATKLVYSGDFEDNTNLNAIQAINTILKDEINVQELDEPVEIFVNSAIYKWITEGTFKKVLMTGKYKGKTVDEDNSTLWQDFAELYAEKNLFLIFKCFYTEDIESKKKRNKFYKVTAEDKRNDKYINYVKQQLDIVEEEVSPDVI